MINPRHVRGVLWIFKVNPLDMILLRRKFSPLDVALRSSDDFHYGLRKKLHLGYIILRVKCQWSPENKIG